MLNIDRKDAEMPKGFPLVDTDHWKQLLHREFLFDENSKNPEDLSQFSKYRASWKCSGCGLVWDALVSKRSAGQGCKNCARAKSSELREQNNLRKHGSLAETYPILQREWNYEKNSLRPEDISASKGGNYHWVCSVCGNQYYSSVTARKRGVGCRPCGLSSIGRKSQERALEKSGSFLETDPQLAFEWDYGKNTVDASECVRNSHTYGWWLCSKGHSWWAEIRARAVGNGCPRCSAGRTVSSLELSVLEYIESITKHRIIQNDRSVLGGKEIDIYLPDLKLGFEVDGKYWHSEDFLRKKHGVGAEEYHRIKDDLAAVSGVRLIHVAEEDWVGNRPIVEKSIMEALYSAESKLD